MAGRMYKEKDQTEMEGFHDLFKKHYRQRHKTMRYEFAEENK